MKRKLSMFLLTVILTAVLCGFSASAGSEALYISELTFAVSADGESPVEQLNNDGYTVIDAELRDVSGNSVYAAFKATPDSKDAITGIIVLYEGGETTRVINGVIYTLAGNYDVYDKEEIYIYTTRDKAFGSPIAALTADEVMNSSGWLTVCYENEAVNISGQSEDAKIYLHYRRDADYTATVVSGSTLFIIVGTTALIVAGAVTFAVIRGRKLNGDRT